MDPWVQVLLGVGALLTPLVLAVMARDRSMLTMIATVKAESSDQVRSAAETLNERVNRVRDEFVRRDDFDAHMNRMEKRLDDMRDELRIHMSKQDHRLDEIQTMLRQSLGSKQASTYAAREP